MIRWPPDPTHRKVRPSWARIVCYEMARGTPVPPQGFLRNRNAQLVRWAQDTFERVGRSGTDCPDSIAADYGLADNDLGRLTDLGQLWAERAPAPEDFNPLEWSYENKWLLWVAAFRTGGDLWLELARATPSLNTLSLDAWSNALDTVFESILGVSLDDPGFGDLVAQHNKFREESSTGRRTIAQNFIEPLRDMGLVKANPSPRSYNWTEVGNRFVTLCRDNATIRADELLTTTLPKWYLICQGCEPQRQQSLMGLSAAVGGSDGRLRADPEGTDAAKVISLQVATDLLMLKQLARRDGAWISIDALSDMVAQFRAAPHNPFSNSVGIQRGERAVSYANEELWWLSGGLEALEAFFDEGVPRRSMSTTPSTPPIEASEEEIELIGEQPPSESDSLPIDEPICELECFPIQGVPDEARSLVEAFRDGLNNPWGHPFWIWRGCGFSAEIDIVRNRASEAVARESDILAKMANEQHPSYLCQTRKFRHLLLSLDPLTSEVLWPIVDLLGAWEAWDKVRSPWVIKSKAEIALSSERSNCLLRALAGAVRDCSLDFSNRDHWRLLDCLIGELVRRGFGQRKHLHHLVETEIADIQTADWLNSFGSKMALFGSELESDTPLSLTFNIEFSCRANSTEAHTIADFWAWQATITEGDDLGSHCFAPTPLPEQDPSEPNIKVLRLEWWSTRPVEPSISEIVPLSLIEKVIRGRWAAWTCLSGCCHPLPRFQVHEPLRDGFVHGCGRFRTNSQHSNVGPAIGLPSVSSRALDALLRSQNGLAEAKAGAHWPLEALSLRWRALEALLPAGQSQPEKALEPAIVFAWLHSVITMDQVPNLVPWMSSLHQRWRTTSTHSEIHKAIKNDIVALREHVTAILRTIYFSRNKAIHEQHIYRIKDHAWILDLGEWLECAIHQVTRLYAKWLFRTPNPEPIYFWHDCKDRIERLPKEAEDPSVLRRALQFE
jgi:hypothetical protein